MTEYFSAKYQADSGLIHPIRLSVGSFYGGGPEPEDDVNSFVPAIVTKTSRQFGLKPRGVRLYRRVTVGGRVRVVYYFLPLLTRKYFDAEWMGPEIGWQFDGYDWKVRSVIPESYG